MRSLLSEHKIRQAGVRCGAVDADILRVSRTTLEPMTGRLASPSGSLQFSRVECQLLTCLMAHPNQVVSRDQIMQTVFGSHSVKEKLIVGIYVSYLRSKLAELGADIRIRDVRTTGVILEYYPAVYRNNDRFSREKPL